jgi:hypothetical protein
MWEECFQSNSTKQRYSYNHLGHNAWDNSSQYCKVNVHWQSKLRPPSPQSNAVNNAETTFGNYLPWHKQSTLIGEASPKPGFHVVAVKIYQYITIFLNGQWIIVKTCKPQTNHKYSLVIITPRIFSSKMSYFGWWKDRDSSFTTVTTIWKPGFKPLSTTWFTTWNLS